MAIELLSWLHPVRTGLHLGGDVVRIGTFLLRVAAAFIVFFAVPQLASAQSAIAGVVRDPTGGVLPGVVVEASSPAPIEKSRTVVTDGQGQYRIVDLRPGVYTVTFTLEGFGSVRRDGIELPSDFTAQVNADLRLGALWECARPTSDDSPRALDSDRDAGEMVS